MITSKGGLRECSGYIGLQWKDGEVREHVAAIHATYSDVLLKPEADAPMNEVAN